MILHFTTSGIFTILKESCLVYCVTQVKNLLLSNVVITHAVRVVSSNKKDGQLRYQKDSHSVLGVRSQFVLSSRLLMEHDPCDLLLF